MSEGCDHSATAPGVKPDRPAPVPPTAPRQSPLTRGTDYVRSRKNRFIALFLAVLHVVGARVGGAAFSGASGGTSGAADVSGAMSRPLMHKRHLQPFRPAWRVRWLCWLALTALAPVCYGQGVETNRVPPKAGDEPPSSEAQTRGRWDWLTNPDRWNARHDLLSAGVIGAVDRIDRISGDDRLDDDTRQSRLHVKAGGEYSKEDEFSLSTNIRLRLALPRLQNRLQLIFNDEVGAENVEASSDLAEAAEESKADLALRYIASDSVRHRLSFDTGVRGIDPLQGLGRVRGWVATPVGQWELRLTETVAWYTRDGFASTTEMRWTRPLRHHWWIRSTSQLTWEENESGVTPGQVFAVGRTPSERRAYRLQASGTWPETPHTDSARYQADFTFRQALHKNWLFLEIVPGVDFRQTRDYDPNPGIALRLELILGDVR